MKDDLGNSLEKKVAVVTGGLRGLGAASVRRLARRGCKVIVADIQGGEAVDDPDLLSVVEDFRRLDVRKSDDWNSFLKRLIGDFGRLDILHLNAGVVARPFDQPLDDDPLQWFNHEVLERVASVNIFGVANGIIAALPELRNSGGSIVITASLAAVRGMVADPVYCMTKHGVLGLARALAPRLEKDGVRISVVCPGGMMTRMVPEIMRGTKLSSPDFVGEVVAEIAAGDRRPGIWLTPADGSVRQFEFDPLDYTADQAGRGLCHPSSDITATVER